MNDTQLRQWFTSQAHFSIKAFGPGTRAEGVCKHIEKEVGEVRANPRDVMEWIDVITLGSDGAWRCLKEQFPWMTLEQIGDLVAEALLHKHEVNKARDWPDWREVGEDQPIEHSKTTTSGQHSAPPSTPAVGCPKCHGQGFVCTNLHHGHNSECDRCDGKGWILDRSGSEPPAVSRETTLRALEEQARDLSLALQKVEHEYGPCVRVVARSAKATYEHLRREVRRLRQAEGNTEIPDDSFGNGY